MNKKQKNKNQQKPENVLEFSPFHAIEWEENDDNTVTIIKPKFQNVLLVKFLLPLLKYKNFKIQLDDFGSWVWLQIDGKKTVLQIGDIMLQEFGDKAEPVYQRLGLFINLLLRQKFIALNKNKVSV